MSGKGAAAKILHNSVWYGLETVIDTVVLLTASIAVARYLGPQKLGYYSYINFFVTVVTRTSGMGLAGATRKYMSEFLAAGQPGTARAVYYLAYKYQLLGSILMTVLGLAGVLLFGDREYRLVACLLILSIVPGVMSWVPAQANNAFEDVSKNTISAFGYLLSYSVMIVLTLYFHWDLVGVAAATLVGRIVEVVMRTGPLHAKLRGMPLGELDKNLIARIRRFCVEAIGIQLLTAIVWDRSEMIFLRAFSSLEQMAFYSISFSLAGNLLIVPRTFSSAAGITLMGETTRDPERIEGIMRTACRYLLLVAIPVHLGAAAITAGAIRVTYGARYVGAIPVLIVASILSLPRAFSDIPDVLLRAADKQKRLLSLIAVTGVVNLAFDWALIPRFGAVGAAWANGLAQGMGVVMIWEAARRCYRFSFPIATAMRLGAAGLGMAAVAWGIGRVVPGLGGVVAAVVVAVPVYMILVRLMHGLERTDRTRLTLIGNRLPGAAGRGFSSLIAFATPEGGEIPSATSL